MMAGITFANGILTINGNNFDDVAEVRFEDDQVHVDLEGIEDDGTGDYEDDETRAIAVVTEIVFNGYDGDDRLEVTVNDLDDGVSVNNVLLKFYGGTNDNALSQFGGGIKTTALGSLGNDSLQGSRFDYILNGGSNNDTYVFVLRSVGFCRPRKTTPDQSDYQDHPRGEHHGPQRVERITNRLPCCGPVHRGRKRGPQNHQHTHRDGDRCGPTGYAAADHAQQEQSEHATGKNAGELPPGVEQTFLRVRHANSDPRANCAPGQGGGAQHDDGFAFTGARPEVALVNVAIR
jgi:hypothetical protein